MISVYFALLDELHQSWEGSVNLLRQQQSISEGRAPGFCLAANPASSDLVVFLESNGYKDWRFLPNLVGDKCVRQFPDICYSLNYADTPVSFFPGVYANLPEHRHREGRTRAGGYYLGGPNPCVVEFEGRPWKPRYLFSFGGAASHSLREELFRRGSAWQSLGPVHRIHRWFDHTSEEQRAYCEEIVGSRFVLVPAG